MTEETAPRFAGHEEQGHALRSLSFRFGFVVYCGTMIVTRFEDERTSEAIINKTRHRALPRCVFWIFAFPSRNATIGHSELTTRKTRKR